MKLFDILFLKVRNKYITWKEKDMPGIYALAAVSLLQSINLLSISFLLTELSITREITKLQAGIGAALLLGINAIRYFALTNAEKLQNTYGDSLNNKKTNRSILIYAIVSLIIFIGLIAYHNIRKS